jgi:endoglucanase
MLLRSLLALAGVQAVLAQVQYVGVNIAGFEFGCLIDGTCPIKATIPPITSLKGGDGAGQMQHFAADDKMNVFRLPVSWQYITNDKIGPLDKTMFGNYDKLVQSCIKTGAYCAIDIHNFARFNGDIIGQGGPTDEEFADLWTQLATKYKNDTKVIFGLMNEPHELDLTLWAASAQAAVTAIRKAGATDQMILLPGTNFTSAGQVIASGSGDALIAITNPDGSTDNLVLDVHKYLDIDNSGQHNDCVTDNIADTFTPLAAYLKKVKRQAFLTETGAGNTTLCFTDFCAQNTFLNNNSDVFIGYVAWGAGSFATTDLLSLTPSKAGTKWTDAKMDTECVLGPWIKAGGGTKAVVPVSSTSSASSTSSTSTGATKTNTGTQTGSTVTNAPGSTPGKNGADAVRVGSGLLGAFLAALMAL